VSAKRGQGVPLCQSESRRARPRPEPRRPLPELPASWLAEDRASLVGRWCERRGTPIASEAWIVEDGAIVGVRLTLGGG
jgi:hypothetical protein